MKFELIINIVFGLVVIIASLGNLWGYWIKFIPLRYINFSSMTGKGKAVMTVNKNSPMEHVPLERNGVTLGIFVHVIITCYLKQNNKQINERNEI